MKNDGMTLFEEPKDWELEWGGMPEYGVRALVPVRTIKINFTSLEDVEEFSRLIGQKLPASYENYWFPKLNIKTNTGKVFVDES